MKSGNIKKTRACRLCSKTCDCSERSAMALFSLALNEMAQVLLQRGAASEVPATAPGGSRFPMPGSRVQPPQGAVE